MTEELGEPLGHEDAPVQPSAAETAEAQVAQPASPVRDAGGRVTATATAGVRDARSQVRGLVAQARGMLNDQARAPQQLLASRLHGFANEFSAKTVSSDNDVVPADLAGRAAAGVHGVANWLEQREPADLVEEARAFARRRPGVTLLAAATAGMAAGRVRQWARDIRRR
jgi:hypothetical protein